VLALRYDPLTLLSPLLRTALVFALAFAPGIASAQTPPPASSDATLEAITPQTGTEAKEASPVPRAAPFTLSGQLRAYDSVRENVSSGAPTPNQQSFETGLALHGTYRAGDSGFSLGASYLFATPFNGCDNPAGANRTGFCSKTYQDDTLPGAALSTLYEAYAQYRKHGLFARIGDQVINTPWASGADQRIKPNAFQGADVSYTLTPHWTVEAMDMIAYESRTSSSFSKTTLLTGYPLGGSGVPANLAHEYGPDGVTTPGFLYAKAGYVGYGLRADAYDYDFENIANLVWADASYTFAHVPFAPFVAFQGGTEHNAGTAVLGRVDAQVIGVQAGARLTPTLDLTASYDDVPIHTTSVPASSAACSTKGQVSGTVPYPLGLNAPQCTNNGNGTATLYYGGIVSPYSDGYANDPLFTRSTTQGLVDRLAGGDAFQLMARYTSTDKRLVAYVRRTWYDYGVAPLAQRTIETDYDATYFLNRPRKDYRGLMLRFRYGVRTMTNTAEVGGLPLFRFVRPQLEYDF
jgi:hypothetical protein